MAANLKNMALQLKLRVDEQSGEWWEPPTRLGQSPTKHPLRGAMLTVSEDKPRVSAGRVVALGVFALAAKKVKTIYLTFDLPDGQQFVIERPGRQADLACQFAAEFNALAATGS